MANVDAAFDVLGDGTRRMIFTRLAAGPRNVAELAAELPVTRPAVSQHLKALKEAGLVTVRAAGTRRIYAVDPVGLGAIRDWLDVFWSASLHSYAAEVAATTKRGVK